MSIDLPAAWDAIGDAVGDITGLQVFDFVPDNITPPAAIVALELLTYDNTMARGTDRALFKIWIAVGKVSDRSARDQIAGYLSGAGATTAAVKAAVDAIGPSVRVTQAAIQTLTVAGQEFLAGVIDVDYVA